MTEYKESSFKKTWNILVPFLLYFLVHDLAQVLLAFLMNASMGFFGEAYTDFMTGNASSVNGVLNALALMIGMAAVLPMAGKEFIWAKEEAERHSADRNKWNPQGKEYLLLVIFAASLAMGVNILLSLTGLTEVSQTYQNVAVKQYGVAFGIGIIVYGVLSPLAEEIVFRGLIFNRMKRYFKVTLSVIVCGLLFGIYHGNLVQGVYGCILGIGITYMYEIYGSFLAPVLFHSVANVIVFIAGYDQKLLSYVVTPVNCVILISVSVLCLYFIITAKNVKG